MIVKFISKYHWGWYLGAALLLSSLTLVYAKAVEQNASYAGLMSILAFGTLIMIVPMIISFMHRESIKDERVMLREVKRRPMARLPKNRW